MNDTACDLCSSPTILSEITDVTVGWLCNMEGRNKTCVQNFMEEIS